MVLNGGVSDGASAKKAQEQGSGISGIMIGRAAAQKPWVFKQIADYRATGQQVSSGEFTVDLLETARNFIEQLQHFQPQEFYKTRLQRFFAFYSDNVQFAHHLRTRLHNHPTPEGCLQQLEEYFAAAPAERARKVFAR